MPDGADTICPATVIPHVGLPTLLLALSGPYMPPRQPTLRPRFLNQLTRGLELRREQIQQGPEPDLCFPLFVPSGAQSIFSASALTTGAQSATSAARDCRNFSGFESSMGSIPASINICL